MDKEKFHNELAMRLGYERIVNDKRILISVEESDDPWVSIKVQGHDIRFKASGNTEDVDSSIRTGMRDVIQEIADAVHEAYFVANKTLF